MWEQHPKDSEAQSHSDERKYYLRTQVMREVATGVKQRIGLEPWGRLCLGYDGLTPDVSFVGEWAKALAVDPSRLIDGIASLLDRFRRNLHLFDRHTEIYSK